jgi:hypothetical protein
MMLNCHRGWQRFCDWLIVNSHVDPDRGHVWGQHLYVLIEL